MRDPDKSVALGCKLERAPAIVCGVDPRACLGCCADAPAKAPEVFVRKNAVRIEALVERAARSGISPESASRSRR